jgi:hypothetical protein
MAPTTGTRRTRRPSWARTHHTKPSRPNGRRERSQLRQLAQAR